MLKFTKTESECKTDLEKWMYIMNHLEKLDDIPWSSQNDQFKELAHVSNVASLTPEERFVYEENLRIYRDNLATHAASYLDGKKEGRKEGRREVARNMLAEGFDVHQVAKMTHLSIDEIKTL